MPSTKTQLVNEQSFGGIDRSKPAYLIGEEDWFDIFNFKHTKDGLIQVPRKRPIVNMTNTSAPVMAIVAIPFGFPRRHNIYLFSDRVSMMKTKTTFVDLNLVGPDGIGSGSQTDMDTGTYERWAVVEFEKQLYFTNRNTQLHKVTTSPDVQRMKGQNVLVGPTQTLPCARYIETFFDHLFLANVSFNGDFPNRVMQSGLGDFGDYTPRKESETDYYDIIERTKGIQDGITGLLKFGEFLIAYTSTSIWATPYVGLPSVTRWSERVRDIGNDFPWGVVGVDRFHFFISDEWKEIAMFDGTDTPQPVGEAISPYFFDSLHTDPNFRYRLWGTVNKRERELIWTYVSKDSAGTFDKQLVYNLKYKKWSVRSCEDVQSYIQEVQTAVLCDDLVGTCDSLTGTCDSLGDGVYLDKFYGSTGKLLEDTPDPADGTNITQPLPYLETGDKVYGDLEAFKELETICVQAGLGTAISFEVYVAVRTNLSDAINFVLVNQKWTPGLKEGRLSLPRLSGRIIRWRFKPYTTNPGGVDNVTWQQFIENVYGAKQVEK